MNKEQFVATKGDFGWRIWDRKTKRHIKTIAGGLVAWYRTKKDAEKAIQRIYWKRK